MRISPFLVFLVRPERFERPTPWFVAKYSIQLSYGRNAIFEAANYIEPMRLLQVIFKKILSRDCFVLAPNNSSSCATVSSAPSQIPALLKPGRENNSLVQVEIRLNHL